MVRSGIGLWARSPFEVKKVAEGVAKDRFTKDRDPKTCALLYLLLGRGSTLPAMFRAVKDDKLAMFFARDFSQVTILLPSFEVR